MWSRQCLAWLAAPHARAPLLIDVVTDGRVDVLPARRRLARWLLDRDALRRAKPGTAYRV